MKLLMSLGAVALLSVAVQLPAVAQTTVTGRVVDERTGLPVTAAQVFVPQYDLGALTDAAGRYTIVNVPAGATNVRVERLGYTPGEQTVAVTAGQAVVADFELLQQALVLDEVIVTGTAGGTQRRAIGNVVDRVQVDEVRALGQNDMHQLLTSRVPGLSMSEGGGVVGVSSPFVRIRGSSSVGLRNDPLVYIDGVRVDVQRVPYGSSTTLPPGFSRMNDINPDDIESIEVIKGPAAATLYGTEASNGVIQIITKKGVAGAAVFDASFSLGSTWMIDPAGELGNQFAMIDSPGAPAIPGTQFTGDRILLEHNLIELEEEIFGKAPFNAGLIQKYYLSVSGGTDLIRYHVGITRGDISGILDTNWDKRTNSRLSLSLTPSESLDITANISYLDATTRHPGSSFWWGMSYGNPSTSFETSGNPNNKRGYFRQPLNSLAEQFEQLYNVDRTVLGITALHQPFPWLRNRAVVGSDVHISTDRKTIFREDNAPNGFYSVRGGAFGRREQFWTELRNNTVDLSSAATFPLTDALDGTTSVGLQYYKKTQSSIEARGDNFAIAALTTVSAAADRTGDESFLENATVGVYVQQQFDFNGRLFLTAAVRADDNSAFGEEFDIATYPKFSASWVVSEEPFWNIDFIEQLRLRGAWGATGQQPDVFAGTKLYTPISGSGDEPALTPLQFGNAALGPERATELELGFDGAFMDGRADVTFTGYWKTTKDGIVGTPLSPSLGFPKDQFVNIGKFRTWGTETSVNVAILRGGAVGFDLGASFTTNQSIIDDLGGDLTRLNVGAGREHIEGFPLAGAHLNRVLSADFVSGISGPVTNMMCDGGTGDEPFEEQGWGAEMGGPAVPCDESPWVYWGPAEPTWTVNLNPVLTIGDNVQILANIYAQGGHVTNHSWLTSRSTSFRNTKNSWLLDDALWVGQRQIDRATLGYTHGDMARLREVAVQYAFPSELAQRWFHVDRLSLNVSGRNLALLWVRSGCTIVSCVDVGDPEKLGFNGSAERTTGEGFLGDPRGGSMAPLAQVVMSVRFSF